MINYEVVVIPHFVLLTLAIFYIDWLIKRFIIIDNKRVSSIIFSTITATIIGIYTFTRVIVEDFISIIFPLIFVFVYTLILSLIKNIVIEIINLRTGK
jgi:hypothetical protein